MFVFATIICANAQSESPSYTISIAGDSAFLSPETEAFSIHTGYISHQVDLNGDYLIDLIINLDNCGNWGDCIFGIYVANADSSYSCVFEEYLPPFTIAKSLTTVNGAVWKDFSVHERSHDNNGHPIAVERKLFFDGRTYKLQ